MMLAAFASLASWSLSFPIRSFLATFSRESYCRSGKVAEGNPGMGAVNPVDGKTDPIEAEPWSEKTPTKEAKRKRLPPILWKTDRNCPQLAPLLPGCHHSLGETVSFLAGMESARAGRRSEIRKILAYGAGASHRAALHCCSSIISDN